MRGDDMVLVSVDDHICEPADMFDGHVPQRYRELDTRIQELNWQTELIE